MKLCAVCFISLMAYNVDKVHAVFFFGIAKIAVRKAQALCQLKQCACLGWENVAKTK